MGRGEFIKRGGQYVLKSKPVVHTINFFDRVLFGKAGKEAKALEKQMKRLQTYDNINAEVTPEILESLAKRAAKGKKLTLEEARQIRKFEEKRLDDYIKKIPGGKSNTDFALMPANYAGRISKANKYVKAAAKEELANVERNLKMARKSAITNALFRGSLGLGVSGGLYAALNSQDDTVNHPKYLKDPEKGWMKYNEETGEYEPQTQEFGVDSKGNVNYYDGQDWISDYIQGTNGNIYDQNGNLIGQLDLGKDNGGDVFSARAQLNGYDPSNTDAIKELQRDLGVEVDGKWGVKTQLAYEKALQKAKKLQDSKYTEFITVKRYGGNLKKRYNP